MELRSKLRLSDNVTLDGSGNGSVLLTPDNDSQRWEVTRIAVRTTQAPTQTPFPQAELFDTIVPVASASYGATASGHNDVFDTSGNPIDIGSQDSVLIVWTGGIPGTVATAAIRGYKFLDRF